MLCTLLIILSGLATLFYLILVWNFNYWKKAGINGPKPTPLFGNLPNMWTKKQHIFYDLKKIYDDYRNEPVIGYFSIRTPHLMIRDPDLIKEVLVKSFRYFNANNISDAIDERSDPLFARNPFCLSGEKWKNRRAEITPAFTNSRVKALSTLVDEVCVRLSDYVKQNVVKNGATFDVKELMSKYTTDVVSNCVFAIDAQSFTKEKPEIREMGRRIMDLNFKAQIIMFLTNFFPSIKKFYKFTFIAHDVQEFFIRIMKEAIRHRKQNNIVRNDYLDHLLSLEEKKQVTEIDMAGHGVSFFADGFETSSSVITYCLFDLASNPAIQKQLRQEIREVQANKGGLTYDNIGEMTYLEQVLNESLRMHVITPTLAKRCTENVELTSSKGKKIRIQAGTAVNIPHMVHRDPQYYDEPEKFKPERFAPEKGGNKPYREKGVYFPFGEGPRMCLGMRFALMQAKRGIVEIIDKFEISVSSRMKLPIVYDPKPFLLYPEGSTWLDFKVL
uniref:Putative cytochrome p450 n=1 Tax=Culex tarsalis TaxID=7177 RepID=A0A1Q3FSN6_CULTA